MRIKFGDPVDDGQGHWIVQRTITHDDGTEEQGIHAFPLDAMEWRAAEYGIDPGDTETLLDIILTEPYLTAEDLDGPHLYDGSSSLEAVREAHLARCAKVKLRHRIATRGSANQALKTVKEKSHMHPDAISIKADLVKHRRDLKREEAAGPENRIAKLRAIAIQNKSDRSK